MTFRNSKNSDTNVFVLTLSQAEFKKLCRNLTSDQVEAAFAKFDLAGNGKLNYRSVRKNGAGREEIGFPNKVEETVSREKGEKEIDTV